jgi:hypothetical protein
MKGCIGDGSFPQTKPPPESEMKASFFCRLGYCRVNFFSLPRTSLTCFLGKNAKVFLNLRSMSSKQTAAAASDSITDDAKDRQRKRPRLVTPEMSIFEAKFEHVTWQGSSINQPPAVATVVDTHDSAMVLACLMLKYNKDQFIADCRGKLSWTEAPKH